MTQRCTVAVVGSGFAGSLLARVLAVLGHDVVLLERGTHPRFAIGESTTPLANLSLERLARRYGLEDCYHLAAHGRWLEHLRAKGAQVVGIDWSYEAVHSVHRLLGAPTLQMSIDLLSFHPGAFDAVNCVTVLQHVPPEVQKKAFAEVHRILKPGGWFCLFEACSTPTAAPHMFPRARKEWAAMAEAAGFEVVAYERSYFGLILLLYIWLRHAIRVRVASPPASHTGPTVQQGRHLLSRLQTPLVSLLALVCYPLGRLLRLVQLTEPIHCAFLFRRPSSNSGNVSAAP